MSLDFSRFLTEGQAERLLYIPQLLCRLPYHDMMSTYPWTGKFSAFLCSSDADTSKNKRESRKAYRIVAQHAEHTPPLHLSFLRAEAVKSSDFFSYFEGKSEIPCQSHPQIFPRCWKRVVKIVSRGNVGEEIGAFRATPSLLFEPLISRVLALSQP